MSVRVSVKKKYKDFFLDADFSSESKKIGILGASGSGKSLTLKAIAGLIRPDEGYIAFDDRVLFDREKKTDIRPQKRGVGYLFQDYALFPDMTVEGNIRAALHGRKSTRHGGGKAFNERNKAGEENASDILKKFGLWELKDHKPAELSGGEKQKTALARMLACNPGLILLDEPFSAMDTHLREGLRLKLIDILDEYGKTFILVSHDRDEIYQLCDYLVLLQNGKVIAKGDTDELFMNPGTKAAARLTGCKNISRIERIEDHKVKALDWGGIELVTSCRVGDDITHIGIRAHDLFPADDGVNVISCGKAVVSRLPFEWYVTLENGLWWKVPKELGENAGNFRVPERVRVLPEKIILLKEQVGED